MRYATIVLFIMVSIGFTANLSAFSMVECNDTDFTVRWPGTVVKMRASGVGFPTGSAYRTALNWVVSRWNGSASKFTYLVQYDDSNVAMDNGQNEIWWSNNFGFPAAAYLWANELCEITEVDVLFDNTVAYTTSTLKTNLWSYGGASRPFHTTAMHELGHAQGLDHVSTIYNIMGEDWTHIHANGGITAAYPGEDAVNGSIATYGSDLGTNLSTPQDLGVSHWRRAGNSGEYSTHSRTRIFDVKGGVLQRESAMAAEPVYLVNKGQTIKPEFTYENMAGRNAITVTVRYYLSTNDVISTSDVLLGTGSVTLTRNTPDLTSNTTLALPNNLISGKYYWIGVYIDPANNVKEAYETNNATYTGIKVK